MGLDRIISNIKAMREDGFVINQDNLNSHITQRFQHSIGAKKLYVLMPSWRGKLKYSDKLSQELKKKGVSFLTYEFPIGILSSDYISTRDYFSIIRERVNSDISQLKKEYNFTNFEMAGVSLGCVNASMIINENPIFEDISLIVPGHCLAESMWNGFRTQHLRQEFENKGMTQEQLIEEWSELAPMNNLDGFKNSKVRVFLSTADEIISYQCGKKLVEKMESAGIKPKVKTFPLLGHYGTSYLFYIFPGLFKKS